MPIRTACPCGQLYDVRDEFAGRHVRCAACGRVLAVPALRQPTPPRSRGPLVLALVMVLVFTGTTAAILFNLGWIEELFAGDQPHAAVTPPPVPEKKEPPPRKAEAP